MGSNPMTLSIMPFEAYACKLKSERLLIYRKHLYLFNDKYVQRFRLEFTSIAKRERLESVVKVLNDKFRQILCGSSGVEQKTENLCVGGSIPSRTTNFGHGA